MGWVFRRRADGGMDVRLGPDVRDLLRSLPGQLETILREAPEDPSLVRLQPPAYADDEEHEAEYRRYMGDDLRQRQLASLAVLAGTAGADRLSEEEAQSWMAALNFVRLVLGTRLDVQEDDDLDEPPADEDEETARFVYGYLSLLLEDLVSSLSDGLPDVVDD